MPRKLMCIVPANMAELRAKGIESHILQRDLGGYWDKVLTVHPFTRADRDARLSPRHFVFDCRWRGLRDLPVLAKELVGLAKLADVSAVKAHDPYACGALAYLVSKAAKIPYAVGIYSSYSLTERQSGKPPLPLPSWLCRRIAHWTLSHANLVMPGSGDATKFALRNGARPDRTFTVRTGGVEERHFAPLETRRNVKAELGLEGRKVLLYAGRLTAIKFPGDVIQAFNMVKQIGRTDATLVMAGDGDLLPELKEMARAANLDVVFLGFVDQEMLANLMFSADVILAPLSGSALVESALSGTPIVAYDVDWHRELIEHDVTGMLVPFRDWEAMGVATETLLKTTPGFARYALGGPARKRAIEQHGLDGLYKVERECWERVLGKPA